MALKSTYFSKSSQISTNRIMLQNWKTPVIVAVLTASVLGALIWRKKKRTFEKVGKISKLYFFPVKSLKGVEVKKGKCTKLGFEVNGILDRSFMLVNNEGLLLTQREAPSLALLTAQIHEKTLSISAPSGKKLNVDIKDSRSPNDTIVKCRVHTDSVDGVDCGEEAASFFQSYLNTSDVRLIRHFPTVSHRAYLKKNPFESKLRKENPVGFQDLTPFHVMCQSSVDDLDSKVEGKKITFLNFRPNILIEGPKAYAEDSWRYIKFSSGVMINNLTLVTRCLMTTNDPNTGILAKTEPLVTLRKYRIPKDPVIVKNIGSLPCLGIGCGISKEGEISVGDDVLADIGPQPEMSVK
ncbi:mitochondrial amidoxime-reducing component 1 [Caerostris darwini]|uniref:Mitochondrial amidoxime-reducing component 1 n=1 Tax=Caerostris darwini TaxID=1538125 RepID=A0AAV4URI3_9ARAC|nr:mitochondrial amidoxime-reducing component 1 [Caerostris darwini]